MARHNPFKLHRFPKDVILLAVRWHCRHPPSCRDVRDMVAERGITVDASTIHRWVSKFCSDRRKRICGSHRTGQACNGIWAKPMSVSAAADVIYGAQSISSPADRFSTDGTSERQCGKSFPAAGASDHAPLSAHYIRY